MRVLVSSWPHSSLKFQTMPTFYLLSQRNGQRKGTIVTKTIDNDCFNQKSTDDTFLQHFCVVLLLLRWKKNKDSSLFSPLSFLSLSLTLSPLSSLLLFFPYLLLAHLISVYLSWSPLSTLFPLSVYMICPPSLPPPHLFCLHSFRA